jgi:O-antigen/teichoic acid export membrane protein
MVERFFRILISFLIHPLLVRYLGPEKYGLYGYTISIYAIFQSIVSYGIEDQVVKDLVQKKFPVNDIISSVLFFKFILSTFSYILLLVTAYIFNSDGGEVLTLSLILGVYNFCTILVPFESYQQSQMNFKLISMARLSGFIVSNGYKLCLIFMGLSLLHVAVAYILEVLISQLIIFRRTSIKFVAKVNYDYVRRIIKITWPLFFTLFIITLTQKLSVFFLEGNFELGVVGQFSVIQNLIKYIEVIPVTILTVILPKIVETRSRDKGQYDYRLSAIYFLMMVIGVSFYLFFYLFSGSIVSILYGEKFPMVAEYLPWAALISTITFLNYSKAKHFLLDKLTVEWMIYNALAMTTIFIFNYLLVAEKGILGALISYVLGYLLADIILFLFFKRVRNVYWVILKSFIFPIKFVRNRVN